MLLFLLPPSEGKHSGGKPLTPQTIFDLPLPVEIAQHATEKDLKCKGKRYEEAQRLNTQFNNAPTLPAIERYTGIMFKALDYHTMEVVSQQRCNKHLLICSGLYGLVAPADRIANYKLPISTKGLYAYWQELALTDKLIDYAKKHNATIIDLLPQAHHKMIDRDLLAQAGIESVRVEFFRKHKKSLKKLAHGVKPVKGKRLRQIALSRPTELSQLGEREDDGKLHIITG